MVLAITEIHKVLILTEDVAHSLWVVELRLVIGSIDKTNLAVANLVFKLHRVLIDENNSIVRRVGYSYEISVQACLLLHADNFPWVAEILAASRSLLIALTDGLVDSLSLDFVSFLLFRLPFNRCSVI